MISTVSILFFIPGLLFGAFGSVLLKKGANKFSISIKGILNNKEILLGIFLSGISMIFYLISLYFTNLSILYPLVSVNYIIIALLSVKYLDEKMNKKKWAGIIFIIFGCFLILN